MRQSIEDWIGECWPDADVLLADGLDDALVGVGQQFHGDPIAVYDRAKCIGIFASEFASDGDEDEDYEMAEEHFEFNVQGAWVGKGTPIFIHPYP